MIAARLECDCGHRFALHTYFKDRTPCTRCRCGGFATDDAGTVRQSKRSVSSARRDSLPRREADSERSLI